MSATMKGRFAPRAARSLRLHKVRCPTRDRSVRHPVSDAPLPMINPDDFPDSDDRAAQALRVLVTPPGGLYDINEREH